MKKIYNSQRKTKKENQNSKLQKRRFYKVNDDWAILKAFAHSAESNETAILLRLSSRLKRTYQSVRERYRKYLRRLDDADKHLIERACDLYPDYYVSFAADGGHTRVRHIAWFSSAVENRDRLVRSAPCDPARIERVLLKPPSRRRNPKAANVKFFWLVQRLRSSESRVRREHGKAFLECLFEYLVESGRADRARVAEIVRTTTKSLSLENVFQFFGIKPKKRGR